jgi:hypothetical protein
METLLAIAFLVASVIMLFVVIFGMMDDHVMPFGCPACYYDGDHDLADQPRPWYRPIGEGRVYCRYCHKRFKEHPNGSLVEDRDQ